MAGRDHYKGSRKTRKAMVAPNGSIIPLDLADIAAHGRAYASTPAATFRFQPGGIQGGTTYTDFEDLMTVMGSIDGLKVLEFDDSLSSPIVLPVGTWDMFNVSWIGSAPRPGSAHVEVHLPEGVQLPGLRKISGNVAVTCQATSTPVVSDFTSGVKTVQIGEGISGYPRLRNTGTAPLFDFGGNTVNVALNLGYWGIAAGTSPIAKCSSGAVITFEIRAAQVGPNAITAPSGSTVNFDMAGSGMYATGQTSIASLIIRNPGNRPRRRVLPQSVGGASPVPSTSSIAATQSGDVMLFNTTSSNITQTLPTISGSFSSQGAVMSTLGHEVTIKNLQGGNNVFVMPGANNTVDGGTGPVVVSVSGAVTLYSDGISNWSVISKYLGP